MFERLTLRVETGEGRQQRRMDVEDGIGKRVDERGPEQSHEAGETDQPNAALLSSDASAMS